MPPSGRELELKPKNKMNSIRPLAEMMKPSLTTLQLLFPKEQMLRQSKPRALVALAVRLVPDLLIRQLHLQVSTLAQSVLTL